MTFLRNLSVLLLVALFAAFSTACDDPEDVALDEPGEPTPDEEGDPDDSPAAELSTLFAEELHDIDLPDTGEAYFTSGDYHFDLTVEDCTLAEGDHDGRKDSFALLARHEGDFRVSAIISREIWLTPQDYERSSVRHEDDTVMIQARPLGTMQDTAWLQSSLTRNEPGDDPVTWAGDGTLPIVKVQFDGDVVTLTASGETERGGDGDGVEMPDGGAFTFAARCEPS